METPGVEWHANAYQNLVDRNFIHNVDPIFEFLLIFALSLMVFFLNNFSKLLVGSLATLILLLAEIGGAIFVFIQYGLWVALVAPSIVIIFSYGGTTLYLFIREQKEKAMIRGCSPSTFPRKWSTN